MNSLLRRNRALLVLLLFCLLILSLLALSLGSYDTPVTEIARGIFGMAEQKTINTVVQNIRLPRLLAAVIGGFGLGISGCVLQAILRNPLASASTLGISQGASFGAALAIIAFGGSSLMTSSLAFLGSMGVAVIILGLSRFRSITPESMVLAGVALSAMFQGATTLLQFFADEVQLASVVCWNFGDLGRAGWPALRQMAVIVGAAALLFQLQRWSYNALESGEATAISLGLHVRRLRMGNMALCCLTTAAIISQLGLVNFIGLAAPHIVRRLIGNNHTYQLPCSALMGAILLLLGDLAARLLIAPVILPIGAITSFMGAPLFLYLLFRGKRGA